MNSTSEKENVNLPQNLLDKKKAFEDRLKKREQERQLKIQKIKERNAIHRDPSEDPHQFSKQFSNMKKQIEKNLSSFHLTKEDLDEQSRMVLQLRKYFNENAYYLPTHDLQQSKNELEKLTKEIEKLREKFQTRKKFSFSRKQKKVRL